MSSVGGSTAIIVHDSQRTRRRKRGRPPARPKGGRSGLRPGTQAVFVLALMFLVATIVLLGLSFRRLLSASRAPATAPVAAGALPMTAASGAVAPPPAAGGPQHREIVMHLRDLVSGVIWLQGQPGKALSDAQLAKLQPLMTAVRSNLQGPPNLVDAPLEASFRGVLSEAQYEALKAWYTTEKNPPDFMAGLATLERLSSGAVHQ